MGKYGRLLGNLNRMGVDMAEAQLRLGLVEHFGKKGEQDPQKQNKIFRLNQWF